MKQDKFLSDIMGTKCGEADFSIANDLKNLNQFTFAYSKTKISTAASTFAQKHNFYLADVTVNLSRFLTQKHDFWLENEEIGIAEEKQRQSIKKLAEENFVFDRFHSDPNICNELASKIKGQWIENYFKGERGDKCFVIKDSKTVKGFLLTVIRKNEVVIDLMAVDKKFRNDGVGKKLIDGMICHYNKDYLNYSVGTQATNAASINLYQKCGFDITGYGLVWHYFGKKQNLN